MKENIIIVGLGKSGFCVLNYFLNKDVNIQVFDEKSDYDPLTINELSKNEIKTKLRMYRGKHWLIIKGSNGNINIYKSIISLHKQ